MKKYLWEMKFKEVPRLVVVSTYSLFLFLSIMFILPSCEFSYYCFVGFIISSVVMLVIITLFPYQKVRTDNIEQLD